MANKIKKRSNFNITPYVEFYLIFLFILDKVANYAAQIADLKGLLDLNLRKCFYELNRLYRFIQNIEDSQMRIILTLRYIQGLIWQKIAFAIGEHDEQYPRRKNNSFLSKVTNKTTSPYTL